MAGSKKLGAQTGIAHFLIKGKVFDSIAKKPLNNITVGLYKDSSVVVQTVITKEDGSFAFTSLAVNEYFIKADGVGYHSLIIKIASGNAPLIDIGSFSMSRKDGALKEVIITANKALIKQEVDKIVYDLQADPDSKNSSVLEMMRKVPFLSMDGDGNILLKGSRDYKILINGKPSGMMERAPNDILRSIPAATIKTIEVITSPSSKYDAEGLAGIINIITNKKIDNGYNGSLNINYKSPVGGPGTGSSFTMKKGRLGLSLFGGAGLNESPITSSWYKRNTRGANATDLNQDINKESDSRNAYFGSELSFELDSLHLISGQFNTNGYKHNGRSNQASTLNNAAGLLQQYDIANRENSNGHSVDLAINYQLGFKSSKDRILTFSYRYSDQLHKQANDLDLSNAFQYDEADHNQSNAGSLAEHTVQVDYVHPFKKAVMETGIKTILRNNYSDFAAQVFNEVSSKYETVTNRTNLYKNDQNVLAAYQSFQYNSKTWSVKAGVRAEQTYVSANFISTTTKVNQQYFNIIPSLMLHKNLKNKSSINFSYTNRIRRPTIYQLNPFVDRSNPQFESTGSPALKPAYTNVIQLAYTRSKKATINIAFGSMFFNKLIGTVAEYNETTKITYTSFQNMGNGRVLKSNIFISYPISKRWNVAVNSDLRHIKFSGQIGRQWVRAEGFNGYANITSNYRLDKGLRLSTGLTWSSGGIAGPQSKSNGYTSTQFGASKDLVKDKLAFSLSVANPFSKFRNNREELAGSDFMQVQQSEVYFRSYSLSLNYRFGKLKEAVKKSKRSISNDDTSN